MNTVLWILQILLAIIFLGVGVTHAFRYERAKEQNMTKWMAAVPRPLMTFIGICEILGTVGVILPALTGILKGLTPLAALGFVVLMILAAIFHAPRREYQNIVGNVVVLAIAAFVLYGRTVLVPL